MVDLGLRIEDLSGRTLMTETGDELTLGVAAEAALICPLEADVGLTGDHKLRLFRIAKRIHEGGQLDLPLEDVEIVKVRVGMAHGQLVAGRVLDILEGGGQSNAAK